MPLPRTRLVSLTAIASVLSVSPALAQDLPQDVAQTEPEPETDPATDEGEGNSIVVVGQRQTGQVQTDQLPILELEEADIASYGASSIADLLAQLAPQVSSGRGRGGGQPVVLVNGQRIGGFRELRGYPPEAIRKVEVLPEEVALQFGFSADQRVINFILKDDFKSREVELEFGAPFRGNTANGGVEVSQLSIDGPRRVNIGAEYETATLLTENERNILQTPGSQPSVATDADPAAFRSLRADSETYQLEASLNSAIGEGRDATSYSINGNITRDNSRSLSGLDTVILTDPDGATAIRTLDDDPLERRSTTTTVSAGGSLRGNIGAWQGNLTLDTSYSDGETLIDRRRDTSALVDAAAAGDLAIDGVLPAIAGAGFDQVDSRSYSAATKATLNGNPLQLPAGEVSATFDAGLNWNRIESDDTRSNLPVELTRRLLTTGANVNIPIAERGGAWGAIGDLGLNLNAGLEDLSDFGLLGDYSVGLTWGPAERLTLSATYLYAEKAPGLSDLGGAQITTFNVPVYDFQTGQSVLATTISGGNPDLLAETQRDIKLSANYEIDLFERANIVVEYFDNSSDNVTQGFPLLTSAIEAAFPDRVVRDASGRLVSIDRRPVTFAKRNSSRLRYGFNVSGRVGKAQVSDEGGSGAGFAGPPPAAAPAASVPSTERRGAMGGGSFNPAAFAEMRAKFCATPQGQMPDLTGVPEQFLERLKGEDGQIDPAKVEALRARFCSEDGAAAGQGAPGARFDPERFAAMRRTLCENPDAPVDVTALPEQVQEQLRGPDGTIDPARLAELRTRICAMPAPEAAPAAEGQRAGGGEARQRRGGGGGGPRGGGGGGRGFGGGGDGQGRWQLGIYHSIEFDNTALVAANGPLLDLLDGDALSGGGVPRHQIDVEGGLYHKGIGLRLGGNYQSATRVDGSGLPGSQDLFFDDIAKFNLRLFANLEEQKWLTGDQPGFWKGTRLSFRVDNLFDAQQRVTNQDGVVPISYQPDLVDPFGRTFEIEFRKLF